MTLPATPLAAGAARPVRVMLADDSAVVRGLVTRWVSAEPKLALAGIAVNGKQAVTLAASCKPDVIVLDIEMPEMDGLSALPHLLRAAPGARVLMSSTLTKRNAEISMRALNLGAADYVCKPDNSISLAGADGFHHELISKIVALGTARVSRTSGAAAIAQRAATPTALRASSAQRPEILAIGSSTGGPQALMAVLKAIAPRADVPIVVTQHMPPTFTSILAEHLAKASGLPAAEGTDGAVLQRKRIYVAPGDRHMLIHRKGRDFVLGLSDGPPENFCRPAVDPMFRSLAAAAGPAALCLVLTGMGADGREGGKAIVAGGGTILAQDQATSVVWGMPGAVVEAGLAAGVYPLDRMGGEVLKFLEGQR